jgi:hypothetical protein
MAEREVSDAVLDEVESSIYSLDAERLLTVMTEQSVSADTRGSYLRNMPLIHMALDAEWQEATQGDGTYLPRYEVLEALLDLGADPTSVYLGVDARENATNLGLTTAVEILDRRASKQTP